MSPLDPELIGKLVFEPRWTAVTKLDVDARVIGTWDEDLVRDVRLLVPVDVQALVVGPGGGEPMVRLGSPLDAPDGKGAGFPAPFDGGAKRPPGVHLHWAMPDALVRGELATGTGSNRLSLPALPDRWVVLRLLTPVGATQVAVRGWVLEADRAVAVDLAEWPAASATATPSGAPLDKAALTGTAGGAPTWAATYDSVLDRFAMHDPLDDVATLAPGGVSGDCATYVVAGWWSDPALDPLDAASNQGSMDALLHGLGWSAVAPWVDAPADQRARDEVSRLRTSVSLRSARRFRTTEGTEPPATPHIAADAIRPLTTAVRSGLLEGAAAAYVTTPWWPHASLLHGAVYGVPLGTDPGAEVDNRPAPEAVRVALGGHDDDVIGALTSAGFGPADDDARRDTERLLGAFTAQVLRDLGSPNGAAAVEEHEHGIAFGSVPGGFRGEDRFLAGSAQAERKVGRSARATASKRGRGLAEGAETEIRADQQVRLSRMFVDRRELIRSTEVRSVVSAQSGAAEPAGTDPRVVARPAPRFHFPLDPLVAVQGGRRSLRHGHDGRASTDGLLWCRWPHQAVRELKGLLDGDDVLPSLGNGSVPPEVLTVAQEAVLHSPYQRRWVADAAAARSGLPAGAVSRRLDAEAGLRFGKRAVYDGSTSVLVGDDDRLREGPDVADQLLRHSLFVGVEPSPIGVTAWSQPWVPLWLEWEAETALAPTLRGWDLDTVDLEPVDGAAPALAAATHTGRTLLTVGAARTLASAVRRFLAAEDALEKSTGGTGEVAQDVEDALSTLAGAVEQLDLLTATMDGLRQQLLGLDGATMTDGLVRTRGADGSFVPPAPVGAPLPVMAGTVRLTKARLLDAFGRTLDLPGVATAAVPVRDEVAGSPGVLQVRPRLPRPARWMFRLVDAAGGAEPQEAAIDQVDPSGTVSPVAGFLLPDHLDESLEVFDAAGQPVGELFHAPIGNRLVWEIAPGRPGPPDSGPLYDLAGSQLPLGWLATGLLAADVKDRATAEPAGESALTAALRAIDTTLWTVDTFANLGSEHVAGLVGRPVALVRAQLWLELQPEDGLDLSDPVRAAERAAAEQALAAEGIQVRIGELTRTDDGLLGFFVDDDFEHLHLVDKVVAGMARAAGPTGHVGDDPTPITHPYLVGEDTLTVHHGQRLTLTLLMHPAGDVHLTSGILPRKSLALAREWVAPGLARLSPSVRTGPVLIDPDQVRLPKPSVFGAGQVFTRRSSPEAWQDDPILAATQTALLPDEPAKVQDGYIRVLPSEGTS